MTASGMRGIVNDVMAVYLADAAVASAFVARWCVGHKAESMHVLFRVCETSRCPGLRRGELHPASTGHRR
jgi:hypothetical protein